MAGARSAHAYDQAARYASRCVSPWVVAGTLAHAAVVHDEVSP